VQKKRVCDKITEKDKGTGGGRTRYKRKFQQKRHSLLKNSRVQRRKGKAGVAGTKFAEKTT